MKNNPDPIYLTGLSEEDNTEAKMSKAFKIGLLALSAVSCFIIVRFVYAAPVDVPTAVKGLEGNIIKNKELGIGLSIVGEADFLSKRKLDVNKSETTAKIKGRFYTTKVILTRSLLVFQLFFESF